MLSDALDGDGTDLLRDESREAFVEREADAADA
jgi:hypothetical protein